MGLRGWKGSAQPGRFLHALCTWLPARPSHTPSARFPEQLISSQPFTALLLYSGGKENPCTWCSLTFSRGICVWTCPSSAMAALTPVLLLRSQGTRRRCDSEDRQPGTPASLALLPAWHPGARAAAARSHLTEQLCWEQQRWLPAACAAGTLRAATRCTSINTLLPAKAAGLSAATWEFPASVTPQQGWAFHSLQTPSFLGDSRLMDALRSWSAVVDFL